MAAVTMHHFSGLGAPFVRSKGTVSGGVFKRTTTVEIEEAVEERFGAIDITFCGWLSSN